MSNHSPARMTDLAPNVHRPIDSPRSGVKKSAPNLLFGIGQVDTETILTFFSQFAFLIRSGLPLFQSLDMVMVQTSDPTMSRVLSHLRRDLINGSSLSDAMRMHPRVFTGLHISMVVVGEGSGKLDRAIERIVKVIEDERALKNKIKRISNYLLTMVAIASIVMAGVLIFVIPKFAVIFSKVGVDLPVTTRAMISASEFLLAHRVGLPLALIGLLAALILFSKSERGRSLMDHAKLIVPAFRALTMNAAFSDFSNSMASLLSTGVPMIQALEITRDTTRNSLIRPVLTDLIRDVREGAKVSESLARHKIFPNIMIQLTAAGENSGQLDTMMEHIHEYFKERVEESISRITALLEPGILILLGGMVLVMALSIFLPMFNLVGSVGRN